MVYDLFIFGDFYKSKEKISVQNPYNGKKFAEISFLDAKTTKKAIKHVALHKKEVENLSIYERSEILKKIAKNLLKNKKELIDIIIRETAKPFTVAESEVNASIERFEYASAEALMQFGKTRFGSASKHKIHKIGMDFISPVGVVLAIAPFNYPLNTMVAKIAPAIASGNAIILKPSSKTPISSFFLTKAIIESGFPKDAIAFILSDPKVLVKSKYIDFITFTGSTKVGEYIAKNAGIKKIHLELGGNAFAYVSNTANLELSAKEIVKGAFSFSGQRCDAITNLLVHKKIKNKLLDLILKETEKLKIGNPENKETNFGPLIDKKALENTKSFVQDALNKGAKLLLGNKHKGLLFYPTILDNLKENMLLFKEEVFGPVLAIKTVKNKNEALKLINKSKYGLDNAVFTNDLDEAFYFAKNTSTGTLSINASPSHAIGYFPFGGTKASGILREGFLELMNAMTKTKTIIFKSDEL